MRGARVVVAVVAAAAVVASAGCDSRASGGDPPPVPTGPAVPSGSSGAGTPVLPSYPASQDLPTPAAYPDLRVTGVDGCALLSTADRTRLGLTVSDGVDGADGSCDFDASTGRPDVFLFLHADRTLRQWGAEQPDYTDWTTLDVGGVTGVMAVGGPQCSGVFAVGADATLEALVDAVDGADPCGRATDVLTAALAGLRAAQ